MEQVLPYECALQVFLLMLCYSLFIAAVMLCLNLLIGNAAGVIGAFAVNLYGFLCDIFLLLCDCVAKLPVHIAELLVDISIRG